jgi:hypothetical protein
MPALVAGIHALPGQRFLGLNHIDILPSPHPEERRASDASPGSFRMGPGEFKSIRFMESIV